MNCLHTPNKFSRAIALVTAGAFLFTTTEVAFAKNNNSYQSQMKGAAQNPVYRKPQKRSAEKQAVSPNTPTIKIKKSYPIVLSPSKPSPPFNPNRGTTSFGKNNMPSAKTPGGPKPDDVSATPQGPFHAGPPKWMRAIGGAGKKIGHGVKVAGKAVGHGTKVATLKTGHAIKVATLKTGHALKVTGQKIGGAAKKVGSAIERGNGKFTDGMRAAGRGTKKAAIAVGHGTKVAAKKTGHAIKSGAKKVGSAAKKVWHSIF